MPRFKLPNYLRTHRKRARLSQADVAFLLGTKSGAVISRHERFQQLPNLQRLLAYEILFSTPVRTLFEGEQQKAEKRLKCRIRLLIQKLCGSGKSRLTLQKIRILETLLKHNPARSLS